MIIRKAQKEDAESLIVLMKELAVFEDYSDDFTVTVDDLLAYGFPDNNKKPDYYAVVAEHDNRLLGYLVYYLIPFTYNLKPTLFIKELFVDINAREDGVGKGLMSFTLEAAKAENCGRLKWDVLSDNHKAQQFYQSFGAIHDKKWRGYLLNL